MRNSNFTDLNSVTIRQAASWSQESNATIDFDFDDRWRETFARVVADGAGPDIAELYGNATHRYANKLIDVSDVAEEAEARLGDWFEAARAVGVVDGVWRAIPWASTSHAINFREDLLDEIGQSAPQTYDDLLHVATLLRDAGLPQAAISMGEGATNDSGNFAYSMLWSFGGQEVDDMGKRVVLDSAGTRAALAYFRELAAVSDPRALSFDEFANNAAFLDGSIALTQNAPSIFLAAQQGAPAIAEAMNHARYPAGPAGRHQLVEMNSLGVCDHSRNIEAAKGWLRHAMRRELLVARASASLAFFVPPIGGIAEDSGMPWNTVDQLRELKPLDDGAHMTGWPGPSSVESALVYENRTIGRMFAAVASSDDSIGSIVRTASDELARVYET